MMTRLSIAVALALGTLGASADTFTIDFNGFEHGRIMDTQYQASHGLTISGVNVGGGPDLVVAFDTDLAGTRDPDLEDPWDGGNLPTDTELDTLLILQENNYGTGDGIADYPDDEADRPAGSLIFDFDDPIETFGFNVVDVEGPEEWTSGGYYLTFYNGAEQVGQIGFSDWINPASPFYDPDIEFGNNTLNRLAPLGVPFLGTGLFDRVEIRLGGSAGVDNIVYTRTPPQAPPVPEPASMVLVGLGVAGMALRRARK